jgi:hypothetical protein
MNDDEADVLRLRLLMSRSEVGAGYAWMKEACEALDVLSEILGHDGDLEGAATVDALIDRCPGPREEANDE